MTRLTLAVSLLLATALGAVAGPVVSQNVSQIGAADPAAAYWTKVPAVSISLMGQVMTTPMYPNPSTKSLSVQSVWDATHVAFRLRWSDATESVLPNLRSTTDGVAIQMPENPDTPSAFTMGDAKNASYIMNWRASFQRDVAKGSRHTRDVYPNMWSDAYHDRAGRIGDARDYEDGSLRDRRAFVPASIANNPVAEPRTSAVEEIVAFGFSNFNSIAVQDVTGRGGWKNGEWTVVVIRRRTSSAPHVPSVVPEKPTRIGFAVWEGGKGEVGPRKAVSIWQPFSMAR